MKMQKKLAVLVMLAMVAMMALACSAPEESDVPPVQEPVVEQPKAEEPKAEEPKAEEPKAEEPVAEEPKAEEPKADEPKADEPKAEEPKADGAAVQELVGEGNGFGGPIKVQVTKEGDKIVDVKILSHGETAGISDNAINNLPGAIVAAQSADVDTVAGCTMSSKGIIEAVKQALAN